METTLKDDIINALNKIVDMFYVSNKSANINDFITLRDRVKHAVITESEENRMQAILGSRWSIQRYGSITNPEYGYTFIYSVHCHTVSNEKIKKKGIEAICKALKDLYE